MIYPGARQALNYIRKYVDVNFSKDNEPTNNKNNFIDINRGSHQLCKLL